MAEFIDNWGEVVRVLDRIRDDLDGDSEFEFSDEEKEAIGLLDELHKPVDQLPLALQRACRQQEASAFLEKRKQQFQEGWRLAGKCVRQTIERRRAALHRRKCFLRAYAVWARERRAQARMRLALGPSAFYV